MDTQKKKWMQRILSGILVLLGFSECSNNGDDPYVCLYGTPTADYQILGTVTDQEGKPLEGIQVIVKDNFVSWEGEEKMYYPNYDTIYTDAKGKYTSRKAHSTGVHQQVAVFNDIDGEANGGSFKTDSLCVKKEQFQIKQIKDGGGWWYAGDFELTGNIQLTKKETEQTTEN